MEEISSYRYWNAAILMILVSSLFIFSFIPLKRKNWRVLGITEAFIVALYTEMYGFPLTIYLLTSVFGMKIPFVHTKGHLWATLFGWGETGTFIEMFIGQLITILGISLVIAGWKKIYKAKTKDLVTSGIYAYIRHPQYTGIVLAAFGTFVHWPTLPTLLMLPILIVAYYKLARKEEAEMLAKFGEAYQNYKKRVPMSLPLLSKLKEDIKIQYQKKVKDKKYIFRIFILMVLLVGGFVIWTRFSCPSCNASEKSPFIQDSFIKIVSPVPQVGSSAPYFVLKDLNSKTVSLDTFKGKSVLLVFWATYCGWCAKEKKDLIRFTYEKKGKIEVVAIVNEAKEDVLAYIKKEGINFVILLDEERKTFEKYQTLGTPTHFLINKEGVIVAKKPGYTNYDGLLTLFRALNDE